MKRAGIVCVLFALLIGTPVGPADAAKRRPEKVTREAEETYGLPWLGTPSVPAGACVSWAGVGNPCPTFPISKSERWVTMEVTDASGTPTAFKIYQITAGDLNVEVTPVGGPFCGSSGKDPVELTPGLTVHIKVYALGEAVCPGSVGTSGTVRGVFSNVR